MKKLSIKNVIIACLLFMMTSSVYAVEPQRLWFNATSYENIQKTLSGLRADGFLNKNHQILNIGLAKYAYGAALEMNLIKFAPKEAQTAAGWIAYFRKENKIQSEFTAVSEFRRKGQAEGYWMPENKLNVQKSGVTVYPLAEIEGVVQGMRVLSENPGTNSSARLKQVDTLSAELLKVSKTVGTLKSDSAKAKAFKVSVEETMDQLWSGLTDLRKGYVLTNSKLSALEADLSKLSGLAATVAKLEGSVLVLHESVTSQSVRIENVAGAVSDLKSSLPEMIGSQIDTKVVTINDNHNKLSFYVVIIAVSLILLTVGLVIRLYRQNTKKKIARITALKEKKQLSNRLDSIVDEANIQSSEISLLKDDNEFIRKKVCGYYFDDSTITKANLEKLEIDGSSIGLTLKSVDDLGGNVHIELQRTGTNQVTVWGVLRDKVHTTPLIIDSLDKVANKIRRAGARDCIEGIDIVQNAMEKAVDKAA